MAVFRMNFSALESASNRIDGLAKRIDAVVEEMESCDVANDDFDFAGAMAILANSANGIYEKVKATHKYINTSMTKHKDLQAKLVISAGSNDELPDKEVSVEETPSIDTLSATTETDPSAIDSTVEKIATDDTPPKIENPVQYNNHVSSGTSSKHSATSVKTVKEKTKNHIKSVVAVPPVLSGIDYLDSIISDEEAEADLVQLKEETSTDILYPVDTNLPQTISTVEAPSTISKDSSRVFMDDDFTYDEKGYAKLGDNYVVSCNENIGKVGDEIIITSSNGESVNCVVGNTTNSTDSIDIIVDKVSYSPEANTIPQNYNSHIARIENKGQSKLLPSIELSSGATTNVASNIKVNNSTMDDNNQTGDDNNG